MGLTWRLKSFIHVGVLTGLLVSPIAFSDERAPDVHYCPETATRCSYHEAIDFIPYEELTPKQSQLISNFLKLDPHEPNRSWQEWADQNNDQAASFLSLTRAMSRLSLVMSDGSRVNGMDMIIRINRILGVRIMVELDRGIMAHWMDSRGRFEIMPESGKAQKGEFPFVNHTVLLEGSLHEGYDVQWYSAISSFNSPRLQINYRFSDSEGDIDLDVPVWIWGFIPNFRHLTYEGSDTRQFFKSYTKRFGNPGFQVYKRKVRR